MVRKRVLKASRKGLTAPASPMKQEGDESSEDCGFIRGKFIDGVEYMEMINWDDYEENWFTQVKS